LNTQHRIVSHSFTAATGEIRAGNRAVRKRASCRSEQRVRE